MILLCDIFGLRLTVDFRSLEIYVFDLQIKKKQFLVHREAPPKTDTNLLILLTYEPAESTLDLCLYTLSGELQLLWDERAPEIDSSLSEVTTQRHIHRLT